MALRDQVVAGSSNRNDFSLVSSKAALIIIDVQKYLSTPQHEGQAKQNAYLFNEALPVAIDNIHQLTDAFRDARDAPDNSATTGCEVIFVYLQAATKDGRDISLDYKLSGPGLTNIPTCNATINDLFFSDLKPNLVKGKGDIMVSKTSCSVFLSTNLDYMLKNLGIEQVVIAGQLTDQCVESAVRDAADLGYFVTLVEDACAAKSPENHAKGLHGAQGFARIVSTSQVLDELRAPAATYAATVVSQDAGNTGSVAAPLTHEQVAAYLEARGLDRAVEELERLAYEEDISPAIPEENAVTDGDAPMPLDPEEDSIPDESENDDIVDGEGEEGEEEGEEENTETSDFTGPIPDADVTPQEDMLTEQSREEKELGGALSAWAKSIDSSHQKDSDDTIPVEDAPVVDEDEDGPFVDEPEEEAPTSYEEKDLVEEEALPSADDEAEEINSMDEDDDSVGAYADLEGNEEVVEESENTTEEKEDSIQEEVEETGEEEQKEDGEEQGEDSEVVEEAAEDEEVEGEEDDDKEDEIVDTVQHSDTEEGAIPPDPEEVLADPIMDESESSKENLVKLKVVDRNAPDPSENHGTEHEEDAIKIGEYEDRPDPPDEIAGADASANSELESSASKIDSDTQEYDNQQRGEKKRGGFFGRFSRKGAKESEIPEAWNDAAPAEEENESSENMQSDKERSENTDDQGVIEQNQQPRKKRGIFGRSKKDKEAKLDSVEPGQQLSEEFSGELGGEAQTNLAGSASGSAEDLAGSEHTGGGLASSEHTGGGENEKSVVSESNEDQAIVEQGQQPKKKRGLFGRSKKENSPVPLSEDQSGHTPEESRDIVTETTGNEDVEADVDPIPKPEGKQKEKKRGLFGLLGRKGKKEEGVSQEDDGAVEDGEALKEEAEEDNPQQNEETPAAEATEQPVPGSHPIDDLPPPVSEQALPAPESEPDEVGKEANAETEPSSGELPVQEEQKTERNGIPSEVALDSEEVESKQKEKKKTSKKSKSTDKTKKMKRSKSKDNVFADADAESKPRKSSDHENTGGDNIEKQKSFKKKSKSSSHGESDLHDSGLSKSKKKSKRDSMSGAAGEDGEHKPKKSSKHKKDSKKKKDDTGEHAPKKHVEAV